MTVEMLALGGSTRRRSLTNELLALSVHTAKELGVSAGVLTVAELALPMFDPDVATLDDPPVRRLVDAVGSARCVVLATPIYGGTLSGAVKNLLDTLHLAKDDQIGPLTGKKVLVAAVGGGALRGTYTFQRGATAALEITCKALGAWVDPHHLELSELAFDGTPALADAFGRDQVRAAVRRITTTTTTSQEVSL
ncbi:NAD(P)H-dependent oxidoreductase [Lentzea sp. NBC_00516]|uniref:NADPH-dependent FMN reductase n=1 Tax=Lentzea sp. NBC_00516 TaxID=2903582 RepID=UPI002E81D276|nr:NAD(P)H-dependent oxidoreductase [Lentzea sp. NBC_00516]WUD26865.1 NAD(P)H-dependent oxidoreductase [Lentzea sp. NBC_00516]